MTPITTLIITCPVCGSEGDMLHHDIRASLVYSCANCLHEWEINPAEEPPQTEPRSAEQPTPVARTKPPRSRKP